MRSCEVCGVLLGSGVQGDLCAWCDADEPCADVEWSDAWDECDEADERLAIERDEA